MYYYGDFSVIIALRLVFRFGRSPQRFPRRVYLTFQEVRVVLFLRRLRTRRRSVAHHVSPLLVFFYSGILGRFVQVFV